MQLPLIRDADVEGKRVFVRADLDVPLMEQSTVNHQQLTIADDTRLKAGLLTIEYLLNNGATVIVAGHLGRPKGFDDRLSLEPVAQWIFEKFRVQNLREKCQYH